MSLHVNVNGTWKTVASCHVNVSGTWKTCRQVYVKTGDAWHKCLINTKSASISVGTLSSSTVKTLDKSLSSIKKGTTIKITFDYTNTEGANLAFKATNATFASKSGGGSHTVESGYDYIMNVKKGDSITVNYTANSTSSTVTFRYRGTLENTKITYTQEGYFD